MSQRSALVKHVFHAGKYRDHRGRRICETCGSLQVSSVHQLDERSDGERDIEARRVGDG